METQASIHNVSAEGKGTEEEVVGRKFREMDLAFPTISSVPLAPPMFFATVPSLKSRLHVRSFENSQYSVERIGQRLVVVEVDGEPPVRIGERSGVAV
jgi:hypothetical protein